MRKYAKIENEETKVCSVGLGTDTEFYRSIGMTEMEVEQAWNGQWYLKGYAPVKPQEVKEHEARAERDRRIDAIRWRIERYQTQEAAGLETTDTAEHYKAILLYVQALRDIPEQAGFPDAIEWPAEPTGESEKTADPVSEITEEETEIEEETEQP